MDSYWDKIEVEGILLEKVSHMDAVKDCMNSGSFVGYITDGNIPPSDLLTDKHLALNISVNNREGINKAISKYYHNPLRKKIDNDKPLNMQIYRSLGLIEPAPIEKLDIQPKTIYVCGKMSGLPNYNRANFNRVSKTLRYKDFVVENPAEIEDNPDWEWEDYMKKGLTMMLGCDTLFVLKGFESSRGTNIEIRLAKELGLNIIYETQTII